MARRDGQDHECIRYTVYIRRIFGREITKYTVINGAYIHMVLAHPGGTVTAGQFDLGVGTWSQKEGDRQGDLVTRG